MMIKILDIINKYLFLFLVFLFPLFFLPIFQSSFDTSKLLLLSVGVLFLSIIKIVKTILIGDFKFSSSKLDILIVIFPLIYLISSLLSPVGKFDSFVLPGTTTFMILASTMYFFTNQFKQKDKMEIENILIISAVIASSALMIKNFSTFGNLINSLTFLVLILPIPFYKLIKDEKIFNKILFGVAGFIIFAGLFLSFYSILLNKNDNLKLPSFTISWQVAADSLKQNPILGAGPTNFLASFNKFKPITFNTSKDWGVKYVVSRNTPLTIITEVGLLGIFIFFAIVYVLLKKLDFDKPIYLSIILFFIISLFLPISPVVFPIFFLVIAINSETKEFVKSFASNIPIIIMAIPLLFLMILGLFASYKIFYSEYLFENVIKDVAKDNGSKAYSELNKAISVNKYSDRYHLASAELSLAIANSLAKKEKLTDIDKDTISQLIQQAIVEAKAAASLNQQKSANWEKLGDIYSSIATFAKDADTFAIQAYNQAIFLEPINPVLRIKLGGIYYEQGKFNEAVKTFELAVLAKPDYANAHYNLAMAYKENKQLDKAKEQMNITLSLVGKNTTDYETAKKELENLTNK